MKLESMVDKISLGDCYELIKKIPDKSIDCVYIDIPYLYDENGGSYSELGKRIQKIDKQDLSGINRGIDYSIFNEIKRVLKKINVFVWCSKLQIRDILNIFNMESVRYEILVWCKSNPTPSCNNKWLPDIEYCLYFREKGVVLNDGYELKKKWCVTPINKADKEKYHHPTIKPLELVKKHLLHSTSENDIVLDCFCGSGTTCVAAKETNRHFIGMEINEEYWKIANNRLNGILANGQISIFTKIEDEVE